MNNNNKTPETVTITKTEYDELKAQIAFLTEQLKLSLHKRFGASGEQTDGQLCLFNEAEITAVPAVFEPEIAEVKSHFRKRTRLTTDKLPDDLPVEVVVHELPEDERVCEECENALHKMGEDCREELKIIPAKAVIVRHIRHVYSCRTCEKENDHVPVVKAAMPEPVIKNSFSSPEAVAHIMCQKFVMGVPLYRQEQEWNRQGILLSRQTMSNWLIRCAEDWLVPLYDHLKVLLLERTVLHADETTLQVLHEPDKTTQSKSYMWLYRTSGDTVKHIVLYEYKPDRKAVNPEAFLKEFSGYLHADGYEGYHKLPGNVTVVGCWAHLRRKFDEALKSLPKEKQESSLAGDGVRWCNRLFHLEKQFALMSVGERQKEREQKSKPLMNGFFAWADSLNVLPKSLLGKAVYYARTQRVYLERYLLDGRLEISNNRAERSIKPFVIGRKNWLFSNTAKGAKASAVIYSIIETAKENEVNPFEYLTYVFKAAPNLDIKDDAVIDKLLPWNISLPL